MAKIWFGGSKGGTINASRASYLTVLPPGRYFQNTIFVTNSVVSSNAHNGVEGGLVRRRGYTPRLGELWKVSDIQLMFDILGDVYDDTDTSALLEVPGMHTFRCGK